MGANRGEGRRYIPTLSPPPPIGVEHFGEKRCEKVGVGDTKDGRFFSEGHGITAEE